MGGEGSGRTPNTETLIAQQKAVIANIQTEPIFIPNYSGLQAVKKTDPAIGAGIESDPRFFSLSNSLAYVATETDPVFLALSGGFLTSETDPVWIAQSGSYLTAETDPVFLSLSNSLAYIATGTETEPVYLANSGSYLTSFTESDPVFLAQSGSFLTVETDPRFIALSASLAYEPTLTKGDLEASGSGITVYNGTGAVIGTGTKISVEGAGDEADPIWIAQSGSYLKTANLAASETDPKFFALSNSIATYMPMNLSHSTWYMPMSLSQSSWYFPMSLSHSVWYMPMALSASLTYIPLSLSSSWNTDLASGSAHFVDTTDPHGATLTQTNIIGGHISGSAISGSFITVLGDQDATSGSFCRNIVISTTSGGMTATSFTQGSVLLVYT